MINSTMFATLLVALFVCATIADKAPPKFPDQYYVKGIFSIPYFNITEPVEIWYDAVHGRELISYYNGMDKYLTFKNVQYAITPQIDKLVCKKAVGDSGPLTSLFPDLSNDWSFKGITNTQGIRTMDFRQTVTNYSKTAQYDMYITQSGVPVQLYLDGVDFIFDSHPDIYVMDYGLYLPNYVDDAAFEIPTICKNAEEVPREKFRTGFAAMAFAALNKKTNANDEEIEGSFKQFIQKHNKKYEDKDEYVQRFQIFKKTLSFINEHNSNPDKTHTVAINHFADMTDEEFKTLITPKVKRPHNNEATFTHQLSGTVLPDAIDWRAKGAVTPVKDQGVCGSCYAFGSIGSLEGVYQIATGKLVSMSEQQIVDCAWSSEGGEGGVQGCDGGYASAVYQWMINNGGLATEESYPYLMQNGYCKASDHSSGVKVKAYVNMTSGESYLQDALATKGPVAVAIDASHPPFRYYASGVYYQSDCKNDMDDLDHEVLAVGYGAEQGQDYWIVKNSWSTHWGDNGYVKMARNRNNNCGIATQANYPIV